jgi:hypothetical protein
MQRALQSRFEGEIGRISIMAQQSANVAKLVKGSSIAGMIISAVQLVVNAILLI